MKHPLDAQRIEPARHESGMRAVIGQPPILVVDDERLVLRVIALGLVEAGYPVIPYDDPVEALELVIAKPKAIRVLVTDLVMPSMSGVELAKAVRAIEPRIRIVMHSSLRPDTVRASCFDACVPKTGNLEYLIQALSW